MAMSAAFHPLAVLQASTVFTVLLVFLVADAEGRHRVYDCPPFSCGHLRNVAFPFRRRGDPPGCGVPSHELVCTDSKATLRVGNGTYNVVSINYTDSTFWVVEANLGTQSSCLLPHWDHIERHIEYYTIYARSVDRSVRIEFAPSRWMTWATFVNCSQPIENIGLVYTYKPVSCLSTNSSFIYVTIGDSSPYAGNFEPLCGYLAMTPLNGPVNGNYADVMKFMKSGFALQFPYYRALQFPYYFGFKNCQAVASSMKDFNDPTSGGIMNWIWELVTADMEFWFCLLQQLRVSNVATSIVSAESMDLVFMSMWTLKLVPGTSEFCILDLVLFILSEALFHVYKPGFSAALCRFVLAPLVVFTFLSHKYWKTRITTDAVEKFLRMQQMLGGPTRYAYTEITAITSHFRDKLGQGGYGSVYKGVLLAGGVHVAVKMLGNSNCNGEDFISEVSTVGKIHHINVVRLVGFCSEEMRRALIYEYMPRGSLDKYIFSSEKSFSWDKLIEIALGIARGINYLHQGCDLQILHFDIKPHNILLDHNFVPKVADFGLAKLFPRDTCFVPMSVMRGTIGYIAPEMVSRGFGVISSKSDVYSFGMLLLEMAGGRRNADPNVANSSQNYYPSWVYDRLIGEQVHEISSVVDMHELEKKLCIVGLWCIQMKSHDRPTMSEVIEMLEAGDDGLVMPSRPFFCDEGEHIPDVGSYYLSSQLNDIEEEDE